LESQSKSKVFIIAIDGFSSCGKSTLARQLAKHLKFIYIDTGAMYRAVTHYFIKHDINIKDSEAVAKALEELKITFKEKDGRNLTYLNGEDVEAVIRSFEVSQSVSEVAALPEVRKQMVAQQRQLSHKHCVVMDGRDIGTVVFPNAEIKFFLTADENIRAKRRYDELKAKNTDTNITLDEVLSNLQHRDHIDTTRADSPLSKAHDAILIDNTSLSKSEQFELALKYIRKILPGKD
jgi:cytidylate kinase